MNKLLEVNLALDGKNQTWEEVNCEKPDANCFGSLCILIHQSMPSIYLIVCQHHARLLIIHGFEEYE